jgi:hypothetical protein
MSILDSKSNLIEVRTTKVMNVWSSGGICIVNIVFSPVAFCFLYKTKDLTAPLLSPIFLS